VIPGVYTPLLEKKHKPALVFYEQIYDRLLIELYDINRDGPEYVHTSPFGILA
jgi:hypothetical protein